VGGGVADAVAVIVTVTVEVDTDGVGIGGVVWCSTGGGVGVQGGVGVGGHGFLVGGVVQLYPQQLLPQPLPPQLDPHPPPPPPQLVPHPPEPQPLPPQLVPQLPSFLPGSAACCATATWPAGVIACAAVPVRISVAPTAKLPDITRIRIFITAPLLKRRAVYRPWHSRDR
jgi:hypothetical protein